MAVSLFLRYHLTTMDWATIGEKLNLQKKIRILRIGKTLMKKIIDRCLQPWSPLLLPGFKTYSISYPNHFGFLSINRLMCLFPCQFAPFPHKKRQGHN